MFNDINREKREAIIAGQRAIVSLQAAKQELEKAGNWGLLDLFGGGMLSTFIKRDKMRKAEQYVREAQWDLENFSKELADVTSVSFIRIDSSGLLSFMDYFCDGFWADVLVQEKISKAKNEIDEAIYRVNYLLNGLHA